MPGCIRSAAQCLDIMYNTFSFCTCERHVVCVFVISKSRACRVSVHLGQPEVVGAIRGCEVSKSAWRKRTQGGPRCRHHGSACPGGGLWCWRVLLWPARLVPGLPCQFYTPAMFAKGSRLGLYQGSCSRIAWSWGRSHCCHSSGLASDTGRTPVYSAIPALVALKICNVFAGPAGNGGHRAAQCA